MKKRAGLIIAIVVIALILFSIIFMITEFTGNPITKVIVNSKAEKYLDQNYSGIGFKTEKPVYNFKFDRYYVKCFIENSKDQHFTITFNKKGKLLSDDYESITNGSNTIIRLSDQFNEYVEEIIRKNLPYDYSILGCDTNVIKNNVFTIDQEFSADDFINLSKDELEINITDYINSDRSEMNWNNVIDRLTELDMLLQENGILADRISLMLENKDEESHDTFGVHDITREMIESDNLEEQLMEKYLVDGVIPQIMFSKATVAAAEDTKMMYEFEPMLIKWDGHNFNTFVDFKSYMSYVDNHNWDRIQQIKAGSYIEGSKEANSSRLDYFDYHELGTALQIEMNYGEAPDKCIVTDYILNNDGTLKYDTATAIESELSFVDGKATYTLDEHMAVFLSSSLDDYSKAGTLRGIRLSCEFGENKADYLYVFRTDATKDR